MYTNNLVFQSYTSAPSICPDDDVFQHLSLVYSRNHGSMYQGLPCSPSQPGFKNGITNGAQWYPLTGGMQDFNYVWNGCMEITLELSCCKYPPASDLQFYWEENRVVSYQSDKNIFQKSSTLSNISLQGTFSWFLELSRQCFK